MELLPAEEHCLRKDGPKAFVVLYTDTGTEYTIRADLDKQTRDAVTEVLTKTGAKSVSQDLRIAWCKDCEYDLVCAVGAKEDDDHAARKAGAQAYAYLKKLNVGRIVLAACPQLRMLAEGALLASFDYNYLKGEKTPRIEVVPQVAHADFDSALHVTSSQNFCRFLAETPANWMTPKAFVAYAHRHVRDLKNIEVLEYDRKWAEENKMGLFLSVTNGSDEEPRFLHVKYRGGAGDKPKVALVGKGITFDSGGISLKPPARMEAMKMDMMGAAAVFSVVALAAKLSIKLNVDAFVPLCENLPSGGATKPGDVAKAMNGMSVEIENTDAEGRLVLADALLYAQKFDPEYIVDVATLTGAIGVALGPVYAGFFSNNDTLAGWMADAGTSSGDLLWRMPLDKRYRPQLDSRVADMRNVGVKGGACVAAAFLSEFVGENIKWAHVDIASVMDESFFSELYGRGATGSSVRMLAALLARIEADS